MRARFSAVPVALLRIPLLPAEGADITRLDLMPGSPGYPERLADYVTRLAADPVIREAIEVSSSSLASTLDKVIAGAPVPRPKLERAALSATRYVLRMASRPTPFGLMAGVTLAHFGPVARARLGAAHHKAVRPDAEWLSALCERWQAAAPMRRHLRVTVNNLCVRRGDRLVLPYAHQSAPASADQEAAAEEVQEVSVRYRATIEFVVEAARRPIGYQALSRALQEAFPHARPEAVEALLGTLVERRILLTDLHPGPNVAAPMQHVRSRLRQVDDPLVRALDGVEQRLGAYAGQPVGGGRDQWRAAVATMRALQRTERPPVQVDLRRDADVGLPLAVAAEVERVATALWRMAPTTGWLAHLEQYHAEFSERYGFQRVVPILELLDPNRGLGPPATYEAPPGDRELRPPAGDPAARAADLLRASLVEAAVMDGAGEITLDDRLVERLSHTDRRPPPESFDLFIQLFAESVTAIDQGRFQLALPLSAASLGAGAAFGRFLHLFGDCPELTAVLDRDGAPLPVQVLYSPRQARLSNVTRVPRLLDHVMPVGVFPDAADERVVDLREVAVGADAEGFYLIWTRHGREILPVALNLLAAKVAAPNPARLVQEITSSRAGTCPGWSWGDLARLPYLPRVRLGRSIIAPATWRPDTELLDPKQSWAQWCRSLDIWRERWGVPDVVRVTDFDHQLDLDLRVGLHRQVLRDHLRRQDTTVIENLSETLGRRAALGWLDGHANELVVALTRREAAAPERPEPQRAVVARPSVRHHPGGEWLYLKVYAARDQHDALLAGPVHEAVSAAREQVDRWFFIRYTDPDPHLRLRFHGEPRRLGAELLPALHEWVRRASDDGLIRTVTLDTYEPEVERYGGPAALAAAESVFQADSEAVLLQLRLLQTQSLDLPVQVLAAMNYVDLLRAVGGPRWREWVLQTYRKGPHHAQFQRHRAAAMRLVDPEGEWRALRELPAAADLLAAWHRRAEAAARYRARLRATGAATNGHATVNSHAVSSLLHMHHNRLVGTDRASEDASYAILRGVVGTLLLRSKHLAAHG